jgi:hypothetical protein
VSRCVFPFFKNRRRRGLTGIMQDHEEGKHGDIGERDPSVMDIKLEGMEVARE